ncbi:MAG: ATP-binding protein [Phycisphaerae bacterium]|jgi:signal transduction histidine kinase
MKWRFSLAYPILALVSFSALAVALPLYIISVSSLKKNLDSMQFAKAEQTHNIVEAAVQNEIDKLGILSRTLEKHRELVDAFVQFNSSGDVVELSTKIDPIVKSLDVGFVKLIDLNENIVYLWNSPISSLQNIWGVSEALRGQEILATSGHAEGFAIRAIAPLRNDSDEIIGVIVIGFIINDEFADRIASLAKTDLLFGSLDGIIAASNNINSDTKHACRQDAEIRDLMLKSIKDDSISHRTICEHNKIFYFRRLNIVDEMFSLMVEIDTSQEQKQFSMTKRNLAATAGVVFVIAWFLGIMFTGAMIKPLQELRDQSCATVKHITGKTVDVHSGNELDSLIEAFKIMKESLITYITGLRKAESELREHRDHLEELVVERTENLKESNEKLRNEIREREHIEFKLKKSNRKLHSSTLQLQEFVNVASHDMREPLRKIFAFTKMLTQSLSGKLNDDEQENFNFVLEGAEKMRKIVESLLTYSGLIERRTITRNVNLDSVIEGLRTHQLKEQLTQTKGELIVPEPLPAVKADESEIQQLFYNLISNSIKFRKPDLSPQIIVRAHKQDDAMVRIEVQDNGIGIHPEYHKSIFAMFRKIGMQNGNDGIGAGLTMGKRIVEQHDGEIGVESAHGEGATFWFTLPAAENPKKETVSAMTGKEEGY